MSQAVGLLVAAHGCRIHARWNRFPPRLCWKGVRTKRLPMPGDPKECLNTRLHACDLLKPQHHHKQQNSSPIWHGRGLGWPTFGRSESKRGSGRSTTHRRGRPRSAAAGSGHKCPSPHQPQPRRHKPRCRRSGASSSILLTALQEFETRLRHAARRRNQPDLRVPRS